MLSHPKPSLSDKILNLLDKLEIDKAVEIYNEVGCKLHERVEEERKKLIEKANQLPKINKGE